jgi:hypothetical protein
VLTKYKPVTFTVFTALRILIVIRYVTTPCSQQDVHQVKLLIELNN